MNGLIQERIDNDTAIPGTEKIEAKGESVKIVVEVVLSREPRLAPATRSTVEAFG